MNSFENLSQGNFFSFSSFLSFFSTLPYFPLLPASLFPSYGYPVAPGPLVDTKVVPLLNWFCLPLKNLLVIFVWNISVLSSLFCWCMCLSLCQYHTVLISVKYTRSKMVEWSFLLYSSYSKKILASIVPLPF